MSRDTYGFTSISLMVGFPQPVFWCKHYFRSPGMSSPDTPMVASWTKVVSTHLWNTPLNLDSFHNWRGLPGVCSGGVL